MVNNFNVKLELFTDFSSCNLYSAPGGFLIPFKDSTNREKIKKDTLKMNALANAAYRELEILIDYLKRNGY